MLLYREGPKSEVVKVKPERLSISRKLNRSFHSFLIRFVPKKTKRLIFLSSFVACANSVCTPTKPLLAEINDLLKISEIDEALVLPMILGGKMWNTKLSDGIYLESRKNPLVSITELKNRILSAVELRITANIIISFSPQWLVYDSKRVMRTDIVQLLSALPHLAEIQ